MSVCTYTTWHFYLFWSADLNSLWTSDAQIQSFSSPLYRESEQKVQDSDSGILFFFLMLLITHFETNFIIWNTNA